MPVVFDASGVAGGWASGGLTISGWMVLGSSLLLTVGVGAERALVVQVAFLNTVPNPAVVWDTGGSNQSMTLITSQASVNGQLACLFGLVAPTPGNKSLRISWTGGSSTEVLMQGISWTGVDQTGGATTFPNSATSTGNSTIPSVTVNSNVNNACMSICATGSAANTTSINWTQTLNQNGVGAIDALGNLTSGSTSVTMTGLITLTDQWSMVGTDIAATPRSTSTPASQYLTDLTPIALRM